MFVERGFSFQLRTCNISPTETYNLVPCDGKDRRVWGDHTLGMRSARTCLGAHSHLQLVRKFRCGVSISCSSANGTLGYCIEFFVLKGRYGIVSLCMHDWTTELEHSILSALPKSIFRGTNNIHVSVLKFSYFLYATSNTSKLAHLSGFYGSDF